MADAYVVARSCEMTISREEFLRLLGPAVAGAGYRVEGDTVSHGDARRGWRIRLEPLPQLALGFIRLARHRVSFEFAGYGPEEIRGFFQRFDLHYARGGG